MAEPRAPPAAPPPAPLAAPPAATPAAPPACERVPISINLDEPRAPEPDLCYVRNSSFLSRDIEAKAKADVRKGKADSPPVKSPPKKVSSPPLKAASPPVKPASPPVNTASPPLKAASPPKTSPPKAAVAKSMLPPDVTTQPKRVAVAPPKRESSLENATSFPPKTDFTQKKESTSPPKNPITPQPINQVTSPPMSTAKLSRSDSKGEENSPQPLKILKKESSFAKETVVKPEKLSLVNEDLNKTEVKNDNEKPVTNSIEKQKSEESNGVGDKIKKFEKAAEDASAGRLSRPGSVRGRGRGADKDELPPPATPFKDSGHFDLAPAADRQHSHPNPNAVRWQRSESSSTEVEKVKPEPQKIIKPEFKPMPSPLDVTIRSPSLGAKLPDQFPSHGTAFRNVAAPDAGRHKPDDVNTHDNFKPCKFKNKEKYSVSKGSSYFTRGSEEIWLVKKKDIEEIEERVLDSFRRAGGNMCMRSESMRPASDSGQTFAHTLGRNKRQQYARSESLDPGRGSRAHTLQRQASVACTCGHDKKARAKSAPDAPPRPRSRSHGDDAQQHVLDKYETLV